MKMNGRDALPVKEEEIVFSRPGNIFITFKARALDSYDEFHAKNPAKQPGWIQRAGEERKPNLNDPVYKASIELREKQFNAWLVIESITEASEIEWETVDRDNPDTWLNWEDELKRFKISAGERRKIANMVDRVNSFADDSVTKAMSDFLAGLQKELDELRNYRQAEKENTNPFEPVSDSDSFPQESASQA